MSKKSGGVRGSRSLRPDRGAALVEFVIVFPVFVLLLLGIVSGGFLLNQKQQMTHAVREGARYAATIPPEQQWAAGTWAENVRNLVVARSNGDLDASQVCVALVHNTSAATTLVHVPPGQLASSFSTNGGAPCYPETYDLFSGTDDGRRVQVSAGRPGTITLGISPDIEVELRASATARAETR